MHRDGFGFSLKHSLNGTEHLSIYFLAATQTMLQYWRSDVCNAVINDLKPISCAIATSSLMLSPSQLQNFSVKAKQTFSPRLFVVHRPVANSKVRSFSPYHISQGSQFIESLWCNTSRAPRFVSSHILDIRCIFYQQTGCFIYIQPRNYDDIEPHRTHHIDRLAVSFPALSLHFSCISCIDSWNFPGTLCVHSMTEPSVLFQNIQLPKVYLLRTQK